jgi:hypothetical protein
MTSRLGSPIFKGKSFSPKRASALNDNSWITTLSAGGTLLGVSEEVTLYPSVSIAVLTDKPGSIQLEQSMDEANWDSIETVPIPANVNTEFVRTINRRFYRTRFISSSLTDHTFVRLQTMFGDFTSDGLGTGDTGQALRGATVLGTASTGLISSGATNTILTLNPTADTYITQIICSGMDYAKFTLVHNTATVATRRSGPDRDCIWDFGGGPFSLAPGDIFDVKVIHFYTGEQSDFQATIMGY